MFRTQTKQSTQAHSATSLAIARIFGGIPKSFFRAYHEHLPKTEPEDQYEIRGDLYELYHYLNHTVLFGVSVIPVIRRQRRVDAVCRRAPMLAAPSRR